MPPFLNNFDNLYYPDKSLTKSPRQSIDNTLWQNYFPVIYYLLSLQKCLFFCPAIIKKLVIIEINLTVESNSEAGSADIQQIRSDRFQFSICLSRATVLVKKLANKYYNV